MTFRDVCSPFYPQQERTMYANYTDFGAHTRQRDAGANHPLTMCLTDSMDVSFQNGSVGHLFGARSRNCQLYMSERCANDWDGFCEYYYRERGTGDRWPDGHTYPNTVHARPWECAYGLNFPLTTGEHLLRNAAERRFCDMANCQKQCELFNPMDPNSPTISYFTNNELGETCIPVCRVNPTDIDADTVMQRALENPKATASTLINICNTSKREGTDLSGTNIGAFCERYFTSLDQQAAMAASIAKQTPPAQPKEDTVWPTPRERPAREPLHTYLSCTW